jgi:hypothetical protein
MPPGQKLCADYVRGGRRERGAAVSRGTGEVLVTNTRALPGQKPCYRSKSMGTIVHIPLREYLGTSYRPDREYVDGEIRERKVGKWEHARVQWLLAAWLGAHEKEWGIIGST